MRRSGGIASADPALVALHCDHYGQSGRFTSLPWREFTLHWKVFRRPFSNILQRVGRRRRAGANIVALVFDPIHALAEISALEFRLVIEILEFL
jgi:hypothetical protein